MKHAIAGLLPVLWLLALPMRAQEPQKIINIQKAYIYQQGSLLISETDLYCTYYIASSGPKLASVLSHEVPEAQKVDFADGDRLVIDRGAKEGIQEGASYQVIGIGAAIRHPFSHKSVGLLHQPKALVTVDCVYDHSAIVTVSKACHPVQVGDILVPFQPRETLFAKRPDYRQCRLPASRVTGQVFYNDLYMGQGKTLAGTAHYVSVDLGAPAVAQGTYLVFYRQGNKALPPVIIGLGIVLHAEKTNSTVKVLDATYAIEAGDFAVLLPAPSAAAETTAPTGEAQGEEKMPIVDTLEKETPPPASAPIEIVFPINGKEIAPEYAKVFEDLRALIGDKTEYTVILRGYACSIGLDEYNLRLSQERVEAVKADLVAKGGIDPARIETYFYGEKEPLADNSVEAERRKNRMVRIEVVIQ
ncbi:MAG TPA: OmpA family protein [Candidatus Aminicenantes bacterium]|nr:OmpA family protein [Candidatus Aminicenantes bacterium]